jgi:ethanolamine utilization protein EutN
MIVGKVSGEVYSTINHPFYDGKKLLLVDKIAPPGVEAGGYLIAIDSVGAGVGETVLVIDEGNSARQIVDSATAPLRSIIIAIVDEIVLN